MRLDIRPLHPRFGARVTGVDLKQPLAREQIAELRTLFDRHALVVLPDQHLDDDRQVAFMQSLGPLEKAPVVAGKPSRFRHPTIFDVSNLDEHGRITPQDDERRIYTLANELWHTDGSFRQISAEYSMLSARVVPPEGADTEFADMRAAWDELPRRLKERVEGLRAEHSIWQSRRMLGGYIPTEEERRQRPPGIHPVVRVHPGTGRRTLYIARHISHFIGMSPGDSMALLDELVEFATQPRFVYRHRWTAGEAVLWDNRSTMHRATPYDDTKFPRDMRRTTTIDETTRALAQAA